MLERQVADPDRADADALEAGDAQRDQFSHAPNLPLASFAENETELVVVEPFDYRRFQLPRIEAEAVVQEGESPGVDEDPAACVVGVRVTTRTEATSAISLEIQTSQGAAITVRAAGCVD